MPLSLSYMHTLPSLASRVRLHADVRGTGETRAGGFLMNPDTDHTSTSLRNNQVPVSDSLFSTNNNSSFSNHPHIKQHVHEHDEHDDDDEEVEEEDEEEVFVEIKKKTSEELWDCFCGTCNGCLMIAAKNVPGRLLLPNNNSLGPEKTLKFKQLDQKQQHSNVSFYVNVDTFFWFFFSFFLFQCNSNLVYFLSLVFLSVFLFVEFVHYLSLSFRICIYIYIFL